MGTKIAKTLCKPVVPASLQHLFCLQCFLICSLGAQQHN